MKRIAIAGLLGLAVSASAIGHDTRRPPPEPLLGGIVQERDVELVFDYLREALNAAVDGREAPAPDELALRAESVGEELKRRGAAAGRALLDAIEQTVREGLRDHPRSSPPALPPSRPYQRI